jgi:hypothetical protein
VHKPFYPGLGVGVERAMSLRTSKPAEKPRSRLDEVLAAGVAQIGAQPVFKPNLSARQGYWATPKVYDVRVFDGTRNVAVVAFMNDEQIDGAVYWQGLTCEEKFKYMDYKDEIKNLARAKARADTGWSL